MFRGNRHVVQEQRAPGSHRKIFDFAGGRARTEDRERGFEADANMPPQPPPLSYEFGIGNAAIRQEDHFHPCRQQRRDRIEQRRLRFRGHTATPLLEHLPHARDRPAPIHHREADETLLIPPPGRLQRQIPRVRPPFRERLLNQRSLQRRDLDPAIR